ncbi:MAG: ArsB/NhaD family transporter [Fusobacteriaceae bacterium]|nr:ArsB/NhaD family transporter [Fusobacteriaceae bacterium]
MEHLKAIAAIIVFLVTFYGIIFTKIPKSLTAVAGACLMVLIRMLTQEEALATIAANFEILLLLMGMMMVVEIMSESGIFQWLAIRVAQIARGEPVVILALLSLVTAVCSAFLDNVTTILLMLPISILLAKRLKIDAIPFTLFPVFACNIGGTATMIGDPPNLIISAAGNLRFNDFLVHAAPVVLVNLAVLILTAWFLFRKKLRVSAELKAGIMDLEPGRSITDRGLMIKSIVLFSVILAGFVTNYVTNLGLAVIAIGCSVLLLLWSNKSPVEIYQKIEWDTLFFFGGLFVVIDGLAKTGLIALAGKALVEITAGNAKTTAYLIVILSAFLSPVVGAVPYAISFSKVVAGMEQSMGESPVLWWALVLGACLGGNLTSIGAAANIVATSIAEKSNVKISFPLFLKYGALIVAESVILSLLYLFLRY